MRPGPLLPVVAAAIALTACGGSDPDSPPPQDSAPTIRGNERIGWDQQAASSAELRDLRFAIYVDGARSEMGGVNCERTATAIGFPCTGRLPTMSPGLHTLELAAFVRNNGNVVESPKSAPFRVNVSPTSASTVPMVTVPSEAAPNASPDAEGEEGAAAGDSFEQLLDGATFTDISSLVVAKDGSFLIGERAGVVRVVPPDAAEPTSSLVIDGTSAAGATGSLVAVAIDPDFVRTRLIYVLQTAPAREGLTWRLAQYRQAGDVFGERAVLMEAGAAGLESAGLVRVGPDARLYVALEGDVSGDRERRGRERDSLILRLNPDGTTPSDQPSASPMYAAARGRPRGLDWDPETGALWFASDDTQQGARLAALPSDIRRARAGLFERESALPSTDVTGIAFYRGHLIPSLRESLLIAADSGLHRASLDPQNGRIASIEPMLDLPVRAVTVTADGQLFIATADAVFRARER